MKPAPIKAWAVVKADGVFIEYSISTRKESAEKWMVEECGERVIPVLITPLSESGEKK